MGQAVSARGESAVAAAWSAAGSFRPLNANRSTAREALAELDLTPLERHRGLMDSEEQNPEAVHQSRGSRMAGFPLRQCRLTRRFSNPDIW